MPFVLAEGLFVILDWGRPAEHDDPFVGFRAVHPLFVPSADGLRYEIARSRQAFFRPDSFAARKAPSEYRIFCLGGSTVQGRPFAVETSFTTWLELNLQLAEPTRTWQAVNCGGVSYASYRLVPILREVLAYQPDLIILYTGHNEFLEDRQYAHLRDIPAVVAWPWELAARTRTYHLVREAYLRLSGSPRSRAAADRPILSDETEAMLDYADGLSRYHRDEPWRRGVIEHFRYNLARMVRLCGQANVELLLVNPASNLRDCPPFKSQHRDGLTPDELRRWDALRREGTDLAKSDPFRAADLLRQAAAIDDQHAGLQFELARCLEATGRIAEARAAYVRAKELDVCPLRALEQMHGIILDTAARADAPPVDARKLVEARSTRGIAGGYLLIDHVHPSIEGHRLIADALTDELIRRGIVHPAPNWRAGQEQAAKGHLASLGEFYFARGLERLDAVRKWAAGCGRMKRAVGDANEATTRRE